MLQPGKNNKCEFIIFPLLANGVQSMLVIFLEGAKVQGMVYGG